MRVKIVLLTFLGTGLLLDAGDAGPANKLMFHYDRSRSGWNSNETILTPEVVAGSSFGPLWESPQLDFAGERAPRLFASPLYVDQVKISTSRYQGSFSTVFAVASTGFAYAVNAFKSREVAPGSILWRTQLTDQPCSRGSVGNLSTPVIDLSRRRLYVTSCDQQKQWQAHALDLGTGQEISGWPVAIGHQAINAPGMNKNGPARFPERLASTQRGALNLSPDGSRLYLTFGGEPERGWMIAVDTEKARVASVFSSTADPGEKVGGMWTSAGPAVDADGNVYMATGSSSAYKNLGRSVEDSVFPDSPHNWGQSVIKLFDSSETGLTLTGTYTPFNYCQAGANDIDVGGGGTVLIDLDPSITSTSRLLALAGVKQGAAYLLDRNKMPGSLVKRQPCSDDSTTDRSLLSPHPQPQFGQPGPLQLFGPYTDEYGMMDMAKGRSTPAHFQSEDGTHYLFVTGSSKLAEDSPVSVPPGLARVKIVTRPGEPAYLEIDQLEQTLTFLNPSSPIVSSQGGRDAIVWVLDLNAPRTVNLWAEKDAPQPVLYALDALTFELLWKSEPGALSPSGKYNEPAVARGVVFVGTDRIEAFGLKALDEEPEIAQHLQTSPTVAAPAGPAETAEKNETTDGETIYRERCAGCHNSGQEGIPTREKVAARPRELIVKTLIDGTMQQQAFGLTDAEIEAVATYLSRSRISGEGPTPAPLPRH